MRLIITGGAGFIGSALIRQLLVDDRYEVLNIDKLTYAGNFKTIERFDEHKNYKFEKVDTCDETSIKRIFDTFLPHGVIHLAAETHVDRSIDEPDSFIHTNILGTYTLLKISRSYIEKSISNKDPFKFRFHHVSTDEVYGDLDDKQLFHENTPYNPSSPYSASKAGADHLVRAWNRTYKLPTVITNCSNNYGPYQFPEKLIPLIILNAIEGKQLPVYGDGNQIRDWLYVDDHVHALIDVFNNGRDGETYNIGSCNEIKNIDIVRIICKLLNELKPHPTMDYQDLITHVTDRPGHDRRYAMNPDKIQQELGWVAETSIESGLKQTVNWYLEHLDWCETVLYNTYQRQRLGTDNIL